jgi:hypothetical protein
VTNSGSITGFDAISAGLATVSNSGTVSGAFYGIFSNTDVTVTNSGTITGSVVGVIAFAGSATVSNSGIITSSAGDGIVAGTNAVVTNSGTITGNGPNNAGIFATISAIVTNYGTISGADGIHADTGSATVTNSGTIAGSAGDGIFAGTAAVVTNTGAITGNGSNNSGVFATTSATVINSGSIAGIGANSNGVGGLLSAIVTNSGVITGDGTGVAARGNVTVGNSGTIAATGAGGIGVYAGTTGIVTNSGTIIGGSGVAIQFNALGTPASDTLTVLPGARFGGLVDFGHGADTVNFGPGSWILNTANFDQALSTVTTSGNPYVVTPNQIIVADLSGFGAQNRAIMDITGWINSVLPDVPVFAPGATGGGSNSFASVDSASSPFDAFASFPPEALGYAATKAPVFKAASVAYADGSAVWTKGFGGQRQQDSVGAFIGGTTTGYGGAIGYERVLDPELKIGALIGASSNKTNLYLNAGSTSTDTVFGGAYGRKSWGTTFLDLAVIGGNLDNSSARNIGGGLAFQTATASYGGWFVDPSLMLGHRIDIDGRGFTITPAVKARYIAAHFDGYSETGSTANLTVGGRDFQAVEERAEITFANTSRLASGSLVTVRVGGGILGQQRSTGGQVNIALLGQNFLAATPDRGSIAGGYGSAGLDWQIGRVTLFAAGEATSTNDAAKTIAGKGGVRVSW